MPQPQGRSPSSVIATLGRFEEFERTVFLTVLHRLFVSGSDRGAAGLLFRHVGNASALTTCLPADQN